MTQFNSDAFLDGLRERAPNEPEFHQAVAEVVDSVGEWYAGQPDLLDARILERLTEPDRVIGFRVTWEDDDGGVQVNRGWRVQFNHVLGPYKGGLRFSPGVNQGVLKFLGFEQILKNSLTGLPMGGAKGGSDFDPKGRSRPEINRFCQSFMTELHRHIGPDIDVPAGDIGVGADEISVLFGHYLRLSNRWHGVLTGKGCAFGGSAVRTEATGYGCVYFCEQMLEQHGEDLDGKRIAISGSGNVALYAAEKALELGAKVVTLSDSDGMVLFKGGIGREQLDEIMELKETGGRLADLKSGQGAAFHDGKKPWSVECDIAMPCATQNEIEKADAKALVDNKILALCEGANMPVTRDASRLLKKAGILHAPGKAANAGGVAVSGLEISQNALRLSWSREEVDERLREIMREIHAECAAHGDGGKIDYVDGANLAGFRRIATAMHSFGVM